jgi:GNAT superfamily N-acetyltransferase
VSETNTSTPVLPRTLEELTMNAWPALHTVYYDGWALRFANSYTRRANSVAALYPGEIPLDEKIAYCEQVYALHKQRVVFKLNAAVPAELDQALAAHGYAEEAPSKVLFLPDIMAVAAPAYPDAAVETTLTPRWADEYVGLGGTTPANIPTMIQMLTAVRFPQAFLTLRRDGKPIAVGMVTVERGFACFNDILVAENLRGQGIGGQLMRHLIQWATTHGAKQGYLSVLRDNTPAVKLYVGLGFQEAYPYWYRVKGQPQSKPDPF